MLIKVYLVGDELRQWQSETGRAALIDRVRTLALGEDIDQVSIHYGVGGQVLELAPTSHTKLAARLREMQMHKLADLVDPAKEKDLVTRQQYADQIQNIGLYFGPKEPMGGKPE